MYAIDPNAIPKYKRVLGRFYRAAGISLLERKTFRPAKHILALNYHSTPAETKTSFERQLRWLADRYTNINPGNLDTFLGGHPTGSKPGIMIHFDDGIKDNAQIAAPLLEQFGFTGWFQIVTDIVEDPSLATYTPMTWGDVEKLVERGHAVCSHSSTHKRLRAALTDSEIEHEILGSREKMHARLGSYPDAFCYPGGESGTYDPRAVSLVKKHYRYAFPTYFGLIEPGTSPYALSRCHVESGWTPSDVDLSSSLLWARKHRHTKQEYLRILAAA